MDIVNRLRNQLEYWNSGGRFEAADEIERLRAALREIKSQCASGISHTWIDRVARIALNEQIASGEER